MAAERLPQAGKIKEEKQINEMLEELRVLIRRKYDEMLRREEVITAGKLKNAITGLDRNATTLLQVCDRFIEDYTDLLKTEQCCRETYLRYKLTRNRLAEFMQARYRLSDMAVKELHPRFATDFDRWLRLNYRLTNNSTMKLMRQLKTMLHVGYLNGWSKNDPLAGYKLHFEKVDRGYLTDEELLILFATAAMMFVGGCSKYDDSALTGRVDNLENRVAALEELCKQMNTNISSLQTIVNALQNNDYVTSVTPITKNGETIGYTISFTKSAPITIYHGQNGKDGIDGADGKDGADGHTPIIGVRQDTDGIYYWTLDGEWLLDNSGNKVKAEGRDGQNGADGADGKDGQDGKDGADGKDGITPQLKIENGYWYVSTDNGATWTNLGKATGENGKDGQDGANGSDGKDGKDGDSMFRNVTQDEHNVYFTLANGETIILPKKASSLFEIEGIAEEQFFEYGETKTYTISQSGIVDYVVSCPNGWNGKIIGDVLTVKAPAEGNIYADAQGQISILASTTTGQCVIVKFDVCSTGAAIDIPDPNFNAYLVENFDTDHNGEISFAEARQVQRIDCRNREIMSLEGIESLVALETLICGNNKLEVLNVNNLHKLSYLDCGINNFTSLTITGLKELQYVYCHGIYLYKNDRYEVEQRGELVELQITDCPKLNTVRAEMNRLEKCDIDRNVSTLLLANNNLTGSIGFRNYPNLHNLMVDGNNIDKLVLENCPALMASCPYICFIIADEYLTSLSLADVNNKDKYSEIIGKPGISSNIWLAATGLQELTISDNSTQRGLYIESGNIQTVIFNNCVPSRIHWVGSSPANANLIIQDYSDTILDLRNEYVDFKSIDCTQSPLIEKIYVPEDFDGDLRYNENVTLVYGDEEPIEQ